MFNNFTNTDNYHNAKQLVKLYRFVLWGMENTCGQIQTLCNELGFAHVHNVLSLVQNEFADELPIKLEDEARTMLFTQRLVQGVDAALAALRNYPKNGERYYDILSLKYFMSNVYTESEIIEELNISRSTLYREKKKALTVFGSILWGYLQPNNLTLN